SIDFKSEPGKGTRFEFVVDVALAETTTSVNNSYAYKKLPDEQRFLILVAEDDEVSFLFLTKLLAGKNLNLLHAKESSEAVDMCRNNQDIDLVLMDMKMPVMDGFEATRIIKTFRPSLPIIALTAFAFSEDREKALSAGCDDYLSKPLNTKKVIEMINRYLKA
ncbi:MAG: response regulator, partial [Lentimicrobiaceae bacterium]|nr:response regulator [Lentimicrobiaceae bacterium]